MTLAMYLRLSKADGDLGKDDKDESNSIENQRMLLQSYLEVRPELQGTVLEYRDDGYSGTNFDRPAFRRMIEDAKKGKVNVILVKDISRLGRDYIGVGDYLEQIFPMLGIRFIAVNTNYDSANYVGTTMGLEVSVGNLVNHMYSRDLSKKVKSSKRAKWKQGKAVSGLPPFGYRKDPARKGNWLIDPEKASIVRLIFEKAGGGWDNKMIANYLNENKMPTPGRFGARSWNRKTTDSECLWNTTIVWTILHRYEYTGASVQGRRAVVSVGSKHERQTSEANWIVVEGVNPPIVSPQEYHQAMLGQKKIKKAQFKVSKNNPLKGKLRCGNCRLTLSFCDARSDGTFYCGHKTATGKYSNCPDTVYAAPKIQVAVWEILHRQLLLLQQIQTQMQEAAAQTKKKAAAAINYEQVASVKKEERIRQYEAFAEGRITREQYLCIKEKLTKQIDELEQQMKAQSAQESAFQQVKEDFAPYAAAAQQYAACNSLTKEMVDTFIEAVYVYSEERIEVVFSFEDVLHEIRQCTKTGEYCDTAAIIYL